MIAAGNSWAIKTRTPVSQSDSLRISESQLGSLTSCSPQPDSSAHARRQARREMSLALLQKCAQGFAPLRWADLQAYDDGIRLGQAMHLDSFIVLLWEDKILGAAKRRGSNYASP
jgi:hypothetical protein